MDFARRKRAPIVLLATLIGLGLPAVAEAQDDLAVNEMLAGFERDRGEIVPGPAMSPAEWVQRTLIFSAEYPAARVDSVIDGLLLLAEETDEPTIRGPAVVWIAYMGRADRRGSPPWPGIFERLEALYWKLAERRELLATVAIVRSVPHLAIEREEILRFLEAALATYPKSLAYPTPRDAAAAALSQMGPAGREVLCRIIDECGGS